MSHSQASHQLIPPAVQSGYHYPCLRDGDLSLREVTSLIKMPALIVSEVGEGLSDSQAHALATPSISAHHQGVSSVNPPTFPFPRTAHTMHHVSGLNLLQLVTHFPSNSKLSHSKNLSRTFADFENFEE